MYKNNQYIKLEQNIEDIAKIQVKITVSNKAVEEIDIKEKEPNVMICYGNDKIKIEYNNIYTSVRTIITNKEAINNKWNEIPEYIENVIIENRIYKNNKDKFDYIKFNDNEKIKEIIDELIENEKFERTNNIVDESIFDYVIDYKYCDIDTIKKMNKKLINKVDKNGLSLLEMYCVRTPNWIIDRNKRKEGEKIILEIIKMMTTEMINRVYKYKKQKSMEIEGINKTSKENIEDKAEEYKGRSIVYYICKYKWKECLKKIITRCDKKLFNIHDEVGRTPIYWLYHDIILELLVGGKSQKTAFKTSQEPHKYIDMINIVDNYLEN